jgi:hypothetical protein
VVHACVGLGIVTTQRLSGTNTFSGKTGTDLQLGADRRSVVAGSGTANHYGAILGAKRNRRAGSANQRLGAGDN